MSNTTEHVSIGYFIVLLYFDIGKFSYLLHLLTLITVFVLPYLSFISIYIHVKHMYS